MIRLYSFWHASKTVFSHVLKVPSTFTVELMTNWGRNSSIINFQHEPVSHEVAYAMHQAIFTTSIVSPVQTSWDEPSVISERSLNAQQPGGMRELNTADAISLTRLLNDTTWWPT